MTLVPHGPARDRCPHRPAGLALLFSRPRNIEKSIQAWDDGINALRPSWLADGLNIHYYTLGYDVPPAGTADGAGSVTLTVQQKKQGHGEWTACVDSVGGSGLSYDALANKQTCASGAVN